MINQYFFVLEGKDDDNDGDEDYSDVDDDGVDDDGDEEAEGEDVEDDDGDDGKDEGESSRFICPFKKRQKRH